MLHFCGEHVHKQTTRCGIVPEFSTCVEISQQTVEKAKHINVLIHPLSAWVSVHKICAQMSIK
jgi:hypothetical protein